MGVHVAELVGIDLSDAPDARVAVGGGIVTASRARVTLAVTDGADRHTWDAPVWFCDPWHPAFGLLGLTGFFDRFLVTVAAYEEWLSLSPISEQ